MSMKELLAVLSDEVGEAREPLDRALDRLRAAAPADEAYQEAFALYSEQVLRISEVAEMLELSGMRDLCERVVENLAALPEQPQDSPLFDLLHAWPEQLQTYLQHPHRPGTAEGLVDHFRKPGWPAPLDQGGGGELVKRLRDDIGHADAAEAAQTKPRIAPEELGPADVALGFAPDVTPQLLESFLIEGPGHAARYSEVLQRFLSEEGDISGLDEARRVIHTLKGAANTLGVRGIANLCHHTEDILQHLVQQGLRPPSHLSEVLLRVADHLEAMVGSLLGEEDAPAGSLELLRDILSWAQRIDHIGMLAVAEAEMAPAVPLAVPTAEARPEPQPIPPAAPESPPATPAFAEGVRAEQAANLLHVPAAIVDGLVRLAGEITISQSQMQGQVASLEGRLRELREQHRLLQQRIYDLEEVVDIQGVTSGAAAGREPIEQPGQRIDWARDSLEMDRYNELHSHTHAFIEAFSDFRAVIDHFAAQIEGVKARLIEQGRVNADLHQGLLQARMVPAGQIASRMQRALRNACHLTGKVARLEIKGEEVMLDSYVLGAIAEPLIHLLRNAVDHGIESGEERQRLGKNSAGTIRIVFGHEGNRILIHCIDDGAGLDLERIRDLAFAKGWLREGQPVTESELMRMVLQPGFSTARQITQNSGRGVGMDVVNATLSQLKGSIDIHSRAGEGTTFTLRLPVTLTIVDALLVGVGDEVVAVLVDEVEHVVHAGAADIEYHGDQWLFHRHDAVYPVLALADVIGYPSPVSLGAENDRRPLLLVRSAEETTAVVVDRMVDTQELVMKAPGKYLSRLAGVIGISILGDGRVTPVIDLPHLLQMHRHTGIVVPRQETELVPTHQGAGADVLVVDDSLSVRQSLSQLLEDAGFRVRTARDGFEAIAAMASGVPAAMLVDMEMPRMNGLELTEHVRGQPESKDVPIIMITSRSQEKHRERARLAGVDAYLTKPYQDAELLGLLVNRMGAAR